MQDKTKLSDTATIVITVAAAAAAATAIAAFAAYTRKPQVISVSYNGEDTYDDCSDTDYEDDYGYLYWQ